MMLTTVILDLDGPLLDGKQRHFQCYADILTEHGLRPIPMDTYWDMKRTRVNRKELLRLSDAVFFYDDFLRRWMRDIEQKKYLALDGLQEHVVDILNAWKKNGVRLLLATMRNNKANLHWQLTRLQLTGLFDQVVVTGNGDGGASKMSAVRPHMADTALEHVVWIGDTEADVQAARQLGVKACALACGLRSGDYLASLHPDMLELDLAAFARRFTLPSQTARP